MHSISCRVEADPQRDGAHTCTHSKKKKALTYFLTFPWQQQTLHTRGARGLQLKQGLSLRESSAEDSLHTLFLHFLLLNLPCFVCICQPLYLHTHTRTHCTHCISPYLALAQAHTPNSKITRQSIQVFLVSHKALTVPWSAGLLWYTRPLHTQTHARTHTHRPQTLHAFIGKRRSRWIRSTSCNSVAEILCTSIHRTVRPQQTKPFSRRVSYLNILEPFHFSKPSSHWGLVHYIKMNNGISKSTFLQIGMHP